MAENISCTTPARGPIVPEDVPIASDSARPSEEVTRMIARVGKPAPDFEAMAYHAGGFKHIKLSDYKGQWVLLCFYPGDFTFV